ncbi:hypothetical protein [Cylindrospermopsis raciborskii]|jgi:hypothetical protein|nr:hypothetical protein [Cylindrospermopsis raciborskii]UJS03921.1 hypothetical protein L3I90_12465 [Cylindrospermopsis raciborskii KLL07]
MARTANFISNVNDAIIAETAEQEKQRAEQEKLRADKLAALGVNLDE